MDDQTVNVATDALSPTQSILSGFGLYQQARQDSEKKIEEANQRLKVLQEQGTTSFKDYQAQVKPLFAQMQSGMDEMKKVQAPTIQDVPSAPHEEAAKLLPEQAVQMLMMATMAGLATRTPMLTASNALASAIVGFREGNKDKFERAYKEWEAKSKEIKDHNTNALNRYKTELELSGKPLEQAKSQLELANSMYGVSEKGRLQEIKTLEQSIKEANGNTDRMLKELSHIASLDVSMQKLRSAMGGESADPATVRNLAGMIHLGYDIPNKFRNKEWANVYMKALNMANDPNYWEDNPLTDQERKNLYTTSGAGVQETKDVEKAFNPAGPVGKQMNAFQTMLRHTEELRGLAKKIANGDITTVNQLRSLMSRDLQSSSMESQALNAAELMSDVVGKELTKAIISSGGSMTERQSAAAKFAASNKSPEALDAVIDQAEQAAGDNLMSFWQRYQGSSFGDDPKALETFKRRYLGGTQSRASQILQSMAGEGQPQSTSAPTSAPQVGEVRKGHRFKGGNPALPENWEKI